MKKGYQINRRQFLGAATAVGVASAVRVPAINILTRRSSMTPQEFKQRLRGAVVHLVTPFTADLKVDVAGLRREIQGALDAGLTVFELTYGDGRLWCLNDEELKLVARTMAETVGNRGITTMCTGPWWTQQTVEFARYVESVGCNGLQVVLPANGDDDGFVKHFEELARNTRLALVLRAAGLRGPMPMSLVSRLMNIESVVAMKQDADETYMRECLIHFRGRLNSYAGNWEWLLQGLPYGCTASFGVFSTFAPEVSARFWKAIDANDLNAAKEMVLKYEHPWLHEFSYPFWHASLEYFGVASRYLRPPERTYTDAEMAKLKTFYDKLELYPKKLGLRDGERGRWGALWT